ncbi:hypothetical protein ZWY2020_047990 [Hordeum vulgare]|nr:hypothetical protein ZWY2020_036063 [Hordeum vulgare]KAI5013863.1 hypothetical protein ZWY2020_047990 [Hordeum vulgare]
MVATFFLSVPFPLARLRHLARAASARPSAAPVAPLASAREASPVLPVPDEVCGDDTKYSDDTGHRDTGDGFGTAPDVDHLSPQVPTSDVRAPNISTASSSVKCQPT